MNKYNTFLLLFLVEVVAFGFFIYNYLEVFFSFTAMAQENPHPDPFALLQNFLNPVLIISFIVLAITSLLSRIFGIIAVAKSKTVTEGEKVLWIIGFGLMSFITSIVFLVLAKKKQFME
ncbi:hypothetical protein [Ferruginibacter sp.]